jgi:uncharacterized membrane protein YedE/YeeE
MKRLPIFFLAGALFGAGLVLSGMADPARVRGFLDVTGAWNPALAFVMAGAVGTFGVGMIVARRLRGGRGWFGTLLPARNLDPVDRRLVVGAILFGAGWGLAGFCPGPALANLAVLRTDALIFVPAMAVGMILARKFYQAD